MLNLVIHILDDAPVVTVDGPVPKSFLWTGGAWQHAPVAGLKALAAGREIGHICFLSRYPAAACALPLALDIASLMRGTSLKAG
jgi:hypothetical protein